MQDAYNTREGEVGKKNYKEEELIDWVHVQHDDSAKVVQATQAAIRYLRTLKQGIPTPEVGQFVAAALAADAAGSVDAAADGGGDDDDDPGDGSRGITKRELAERQWYARQERQVLLAEEYDEDASDDASEDASADGAEGVQRAGRGRGRGGGGGGGGRGRGGGGAGARPRPRSAAARAAAAGVGVARGGRERRRACGPTRWQTSSS